MWAYNTPEDPQTLRYALFNVMKKNDELQANCVAMRNYGLQLGNKINCLEKYLLANEIQAKKKHRLNKRFRKFFGHANSF